MKRIVSLLICLVLLFGISGTHSIAEPLNPIPFVAAAMKAPVEATSITLNKTALNIRIGKNATLKATVSPKKATNKKVTWASDRTSIVTVNQKGKLTPVSIGVATITATTANGLSASCTVTVKLKAPRKITFGIKPDPLYIGLSMQHNPNITPRDADQTLIWSSSNTSVATVSKDGMITALKKGTAKITATTVNGKKATLKMTIKDPEINASDYAFTLWGVKYTFPITKSQVSALFPVTRTYEINSIGGDIVANGMYLIYEVMRPGSSSVLTFQFDNMSGAPGPHDLMHITMTGSDFVSSRGIKAGDALSKSRKVYGKPSFTLKDADVYRFISNGKIFNFFVIFDKSKVTGFMLDFY